MARIFKNWFMSPETEIFVYGMVGITMTAMEQSVLNINENLKEVQNAPLPIGSFGPQAEQRVKTILSLAVLARSYTVSAYLFAYFAVIGVAFFGAGRWLLVPWLVLSAFRHLVVDVLVAMTGVLICFRYQLTPVCWEFIAMRILAIGCAAYMWRSVRVLFGALGSAGAVPLSAYALSLDATRALNRALQRLNVPSTSEEEEEEEEEEEGGSGRKKALGRRRSAALPCTSPRHLPSEQLRLRRRSLEALLSLLDVSAEALAPLLARRREERRAGEGAPAPHRALLFLRLGEGDVKAARARCRPRLPHITPQAARCACGPCGLDGGAQRDPTERDSETQIETLCLSKTTCGQSSQLPSPEDTALECSSTEKILLESYDDGLKLYDDAEVKTRNAKGEVKESRGKKCELKTEMKSGTSVSISCENKNKVENERTESETAVKVKLKSQRAAVVEKEPRSAKTKYKEATERKVKGTSNRPGIEVKASVRFHEEDEDAKYKEDPKKKQLLKERDKRRPGSSSSARSKERPNSARRKKKADHCPSVASSAVSSKGSRKPPKSYPAPRTELGSPGKTPENHSHSTAAAASPRFSFSKTQPRDVCLLGKSQEAYQKRTVAFGRGGVRLEPVSREESRSTLSVESKRVDLKGSMSRKFGSRGTESKGAEMNVSLPRGPSFKATDSKFPPEKREAKEAEPMFSGVRSVELKIKEALSQIPADKVAVSGVKTDTLAMTCLTKAGRRVSIADGLTGAIPYRTAPYSTFGKYKTPLSDRTDCRSAPMSSPANRTKSALSGRSAQGSKPIVGSRPESSTKQQCAKTAITSCGSDDADAIDRRDAVKISTKIPYSKRTDHEAVNTMRRDKTAPLSDHEGDNVSGSKLRPDIFRGSNVQSSSSPLVNFLKLNRKQGILKNSIGIPDTKLTGSQNAEFDSAGNSDGTKPNETQYIKKDSLGNNIPIVQQSVTKGVSPDDRLDEALKEKNLSKKTNYSDEILPHEVGTKIATVETERENSSESFMQESSQVEEMIPRTKGEVSGSDIKHETAEDYSRFEMNEFSDKRGYDVGYGVCLRKNEGDHTVCVTYSENKSVGNHLEKVEGVQSKEKFIGECLERVVDETTKEEYPYFSKIESEDRNEDHASIDFETKEIRRTKESEAELVDDANSKADFMRELLLSKCVDKEGKDTSLENESELHSNAFQTQEKYDPRDPTAGVTEQSVSLKNTLRSKSGGRSLGRSEERSPGGAIALVDSAEDESEETVDPLHVRPTSRCGSAASSGSRRASFIAIGPWPELENLFKGEVHDNKHSQFSYLPKISRLPDDQNKEIDNNRVNSKESILNETELAASSIDNLMSSANYNIDTSCELGAPVINTKENFLQDSHGSREVLGSIIKEVKVGEDLKKNEYVDVDENEAKIEFEMKESRHSSKSTCSTCGGYIKYESKQTKCESVVSRYEKDVCGTKEENIKCSSASCVVNSSQDSPILDGAGSTDNEGPLLSTLKEVTLEDHSSSMATKKCDFSSVSLEMKRTFGTDCNTHMTCSKESNNEIKISKQYNRIETLSYVEDFSCVVTEKAASSIHSVLLEAMDQVVTSADKIALPDIPTHCEVDSVDLEVRQVEDGSYLARSRSKSHQTSQNVGSPIVIVNTSKYGSSSQNPPQSTTGGRKISPRLEEPVGKLENEEAQNNEVAAGEDGDCVEGRKDTPQSKSSPPSFERREKEVNSDATDSCIKAELREEKEQLAESVDNKTAAIANSVLGETMTTVEHLFSTEKSVVYEVASGQGYSDNVFEDGVTAVSDSSVETLDSDVDTDSFPKVRDISNETFSLPTPVAQQEESAEASGNIEFANDLVALNMDVMENQTKNANDFEYSSDVSDTGFKERSSDVRSYSSVDELQLNETKAKELTSFPSKDTTLINQVVQGEISSDAEFRDPPEQPAVHGDVCSKEEGHWTNICDSHLLMPQVLPGEVQDLGDARSPSRHHPDVETLISHRPFPSSLREFTNSFSFRGELTGEVTQRTPPSPNPGLPEGVSDRLPPQEEDKEDAGEVREVGCFPPPPPEALCHDPASGSSQSLLQEGAEAGAALSNCPSGEGVGEVEGRTRDCGRRRQRRRRRWVTQAVDIS